MLKTENVTMYFIVCDHCGERAAREQSQQAAIDSACADGFSEGENGLWYCEDCYDLMLEIEQYPPEDAPEYWLEKLDRWYKAVCGTDAAVVA